MKIKHWQGYGQLTAVKVKDKNCKLHIKVSGNHEWGIHRDDMYDLYYWLVKKFDKSFENYADFDKKHPSVIIRDGYENNEETCDYLFSY